MKTATVLPLLTLVVASLGVASVGGCASDKNKDLDEAAKQEAEASREQREAQIDETKKRELEGIEANKRTIENTPGRTEQLAKAQAAMVEERQKFQTDAQARVQKVEARLEESRRTLQLARGGAPASTHDNLDETAHLADSLSREVDNVSQVNDDAWATEKKRIENRLSDLESAADDVKSKADSAKR